MLFIPMMLQPKFSGKIIDIVSREVQEPEQKFEALDAVKNTIVEIVLIVIIGYVCLELTLVFLVLILDFCFKVNI